jgi:UDPglucose 6-dehydrogenase
VVVYDPQVSEEQIRAEILGSGINPNLTVSTSALEACKGAHGAAILTEWDEFKTLDFPKIHEDMLKPAFLFDGRNILPIEKLKQIGFRVFAIGKTV